MRVVCLLFKNNKEYMQNGIFLTLGVCNKISYCVLNLNLELVKVTKQVETP